MKLVVILFAVLLLIAVGGKFALDYSQGKTTIPFFASSSKVTINNKSYKVTIAKTDKEKEIGLSDKKSLPADEGLLFEFTDPSYYTFWMKNMKFPIDIIFIKDNKVVTVFHNVQTPKSPEENLTLYRPEEPANKVLEIMAGEAKKNNIKKGDTVTFSK